MKLSPETILQEMFHSGYYSDDPEGECICPICDEDCELHEHLVEHIKEEHPNQLIKYSNVLDEMLNDPYEYFSIRWADNQCRLCGKTFPSKGEFNRHMKIHSQEIKEFKEKLGGG